MCALRADPSLPQKNSGTLKGITRNQLKPVASNNLHKWNKVEQEEEGVDALGMWPKEEMMTD